MCFCAYMCAYMCGMILHTLWYGSKTMNGVIQIRNVSFSKCWFAQRDCLFKAVSLKI